MSGTKDQVRHYFNADVPLKLHFSPLWTGMMLLCFRSRNHKEERGERPQTGFKISNWVVSSGQTERPAGTVRKKIRRITRCEHQASKEQTEDGLP